MYKTTATICFCLAFIFISCGRENFDDEISAAFYRAQADNDPGSSSETNDNDDPTNEPSEPTDELTDPTDEPTSEPTSEPTTEPTNEPTTEPTSEPTTEPTNDKDPCDPNPCSDVENSTGKCTALSATSYECVCYADYDWKEGECKFTYKTCSPINGLIWSSKYGEMDWDEAVSYCESLTECGYNGWHLASISELRKLIQNCPKTQSGGSCGVTDSCLSTTCSSTDCSLPRCHSSELSIFGDTDTFWSSSEDFDHSNMAWRVMFQDTSISTYSKTVTFYFRCARKAN